VIEWPRSGVVVNGVANVVVNVMAMVGLYRVGVVVQMNEATWI
jgi:hypothetical protein